MLLQSPIELIISQAFHFIPHDKALKQYREQREYFENSEDTYSMEATGLIDILRGNRKQPTDFGHQQTSFMVLVDELKKLDRDVGQLQEAFGEIGLVCVREDIRLEEVFWSTFPGNFEFLRRKDPINTHFIGGFARLNRFSSGQSTGMLWAQPIGLLPTLVNSPYFFNFHAQDNGHTLWMDFNSFNDKAGTILLSFLLTQTQKLNTKLFYFDQHQSAALWFNKMKNPYIKIGTKKNKSIAINPFSLPAEPRNIGFLTAWCCELIDADTTEKTTLATQLRAFFESDKPRSLSDFIAHLEETDTALAARFSPWVRNGEFADLFASSDSDFSFTADWLAFGIDEVMKSPHNAVATISYLLHRIVLSLDGSPTIIVMRDMLNIMSHPFFTSRFESLLEMLKENNVMVIFAENSNNPAYENAAMQLLTNCCASIIVVPDDIKQDYATVAPHLLTAGDEKLLWRMDRMKGDILVIQRQETVALRINLDSMNDVESIFSNDVKTLIASGGPYASVPEANND
jgi:type IV secretion system protein VirB4